MGATVTSWTVTGWAVRGVMVTSWAVTGSRGMRERASAVGGELTAGPRADGGFQVTATLPALTQGDSS